MTTTSFRRLLSANAVSSLVGTGIQAATAPVFLFLLSVNQYASILLAQTVATYLSFFLNGFFYFIMNSITHDWINSRRDRAQEMYSLGYFFILLLCAISSVGLGLTLGLGANLQDTAVLIWIAVIGSFINLAYILVDANFRVRNEYTLGVNILTAARLMDFVFLVLALMITKDILHSMLFNLFTRVLTILALKALAERRHGAAFIGETLPALTAIGHLLASAAGQLGLSAYTALSVMGPQLVVSTFFPDAIAVAFNVHRTYMRIVAALVNIVTSSSWPILNGLHASGNTSELTIFLSRLIARSIIVTSFVSAILFFIAPWLFPVLFHGKVSVNSQYLLLIGLACIFNSGTTIGQTLYLATNLRSVFVFFAFLLTAIELILMAAAGLHLGFEYALMIYVLVELIIMISAIIGCSRTLRFERREQAG